MSDSPDFSNASWFRQKFWPIQPHENKKVFPLLTMMFLTCFNYTLLRDLKDVLVLDSMNAAAVPWLKNAVVLPTSVLVMVVFTKMSISMTRTQIFYSFLGFFMSFFAIFGFVLFPLESQISPGSEWADAFIAENKMSEAMKPPMYVIAGWPSALLYVMAEMWGTVVLSLLFWGFTNDICRVSEAKRFYTIINIGANISLLFVGAVLMIIATFVKGSSTVSMYILMAMVVINGGIIGYIYRWIERNVLTDPRLYDPSEMKPKKKKAKLTMMQSFKFLFSSKYIACICAMVFLYGTAINQVEIFYKEALGKAFPKFSNTKSLRDLNKDIKSMKEFHRTIAEPFDDLFAKNLFKTIDGQMEKSVAFANNTLQGYISDMASFIQFLDQNEERTNFLTALDKSTKDEETRLALDKVGAVQRVTNLIEAMELDAGKLVEGLENLEASSKNKKIFYQGVFSTCTGVIALFLLVFVGGSAVRVMGWTFTALFTPMVIAVVGLPLAGMAWAKTTGALTSFTPMLYFGLVAVALSKATKYSFFDPTKEMSYIPLDADVKMKGKAAVDVVGARFGKAGGGILVIIVQAIYGTSDILVISPVIFFLIAIFLMCWVAATISLGKQFNAKQAEKDEEIRMANAEKSKALKA